MSKRIICIIARVCAGKDTFAQTLVEHEQVDVGAIVRKITQQTSRVHDQSLDNAIIDELLSQCDYGNKVITGIRQLSILKALIEQYGEELESIYLVVPDEELKRRFINRNSEKDKDLTFEEVLQKDADLGLAEIEEYIKKHFYSFTIIKNY